MKINRISLLLSVLCLCLMFSGCFYLRLQKVKGQLADFDEHFEIKEGQKFSLIAKEPVLLPSDIVRIMKEKPSSEVMMEDRLFYDYVLEKQYPGDKDEPDNYDISIRFVFIQDKLSESHIDKRFFAAIPKEMFIAILKAVGNAEVDIGTRHISGVHGIAGQLHLPDANEVLELLGKPYSHEGNVYTYKYLRKRPTPMSVDEKDYLPAVFTFDDKGNFLKCRSEFLGGPMEIDFSSVSKKKNKKEDTVSDNNSVQP